MAHAPRGRYQAIPGGRPFVILVAVWCTAAWTVFLMQVIAGNTDGHWVATLFILGAFLWVVPQFLLRVVCELELCDGMVAWKTAVRSGRFEANDLRSLRPMLTARNAEVMQLRDGHKLFVLVGRGFRELASDLAESAPFARIEVSRYMEIAERWPGKRSGYKRDT